MLTPILIASLLLTPQGAQELSPGTRYDASIPTLEQVAGHDFGEEVTPPDEIVRYMKALAEAAQRTGVESIVLVSVVGTALEADTAYHRTKARAEEILRSGAWETTVVRPSLVYGRSGGLRDSKFMVRLAAHLHSGRPFPLPGGGRSLVQPIFVDDLSRALTQSAVEGVGAGRIVEVGGPERMTLRAWVERLAAVLGVRPRLLPLPQAIGLALAACAERLSSTPPITVDQVRLMGHNFIAPLDGIEATYGFAPTKPAEGLEKSYRAIADEDS